MTGTVNVVAPLEGWCCVIVGDTITPAGYVQVLGLPSGSDVVYLSAEDQKKTVSPFVQRLHFDIFPGRGAKVIYDFDDDNVLQLSEAAGGSSTLPP